MKPVSHIFRKRFTVYLFGFGKRKVFQVGIIFADFLIPKAIRNINCGDNGSMAYVIELYLIIYLHCIGYRIRNIREQFAHLFSASQPAELKYICFGEFIHRFTCSIALLDIVNCQIFRSHIINIIGGYNLYLMFFCFVY